MSRLLSTVLLTFILLSLSSFWSLTAQAQEEPLTEHISLISEAVVVDFVVRDSKGRLVTDLTKEDFRIFEDGEEQTIQSLRFVDSSQGNREGTGRRESAGVPAAPESILRQVHLVSLVFDSLNNESRRFAREAVDDLLKADLPSNTYIGVFVTEKGLRALCPYTTDFKRIREAVVLATSGSFEETYARSRQLYDEVVAATGGVDSTLGASGFAQQIASATASGADENTRRVVELYLLRNIFENSRAVETEYPAMAIVEGISALAAGQRDLPGRKSALFFSEGLFIPERFSFRFRNAISEANLANMSIYPIDARGLTSQVQGQAGAAALGRAASLSQSQVQGGFATRAADAASGQASAQSAARGSGPVGPEEMRSLETAEDSIRMNVQQTLDDLARSTGGFLTANTNDTRSAISRLTDDLQQYYEIAYIPRADYTDGGYRKIRIEVDRESMTVQARDGYFPFPPSESGPVTGYEVPLLATLGRSDQPQDFPLKSRTFQLDRRDGGRNQVIAASVPFNSLDFQIDEESGRYTGHLAILAQVRADGGEVLSRLGRDFPLEGSLSELDKVKKGEVVFLRSFEVPPGRYHLEIAAYDFLSRKASTKRQVLVVTHPRPGVDLSSLIVVGNLEPLSDIEKLLDTPLKHSDFRIIPHLGSEIQTKPGGEIGVYCLVYMQGEDHANANLTVAIFKDGEPIFRGTPQLIPQAKPHELSALFSIPSDELTPGTYQLKAWAQEGDQIAVQSTVFTVRQ